MAANTPTKVSDVRYLNKDFDSFKRDLMKYAQAHFSGSFQDYNESSPGMAILEMQAYVGDVLAFYLDQQFMEMKKETARQVENVEAFAKMRGYKPRGKRAATGPVKFMVEVPAQAGAPDPGFLPVLKAGTQCTAGATIFELLDDIDFKVTTVDNKREIAASQLDANGQPVFYAVRAEGRVIAGQSISEVIPVGGFVPYRRVPLGNSDVLDIISVVDDQGNAWYEVDYLAQNAVLDQLVNTTDDESTVPFVLKYRSAARRFVVERFMATNTVELQFGAADGLQYNDELIPNVAQMALPIAGRKTISNFTLDPRNFLRTSTLGLSPYDVSLMVTYRVGGGDETNVPVGAINKVTTAYFNDFGNQADPTWQEKVNTIRSSVECINLQATSGGGPGETVAEMKVNAEGFFAAQNRAVTREDYIAHIYAMPQKFGRVEKAFVKTSDFNPYAVDLHVLTLDSNGRLSHCTPTMQENIKTYFQKLRMITEGINVLPADVINVGVNFGVVISPQYNRAEVLTSCLTALKDYLSIDNMGIGQPLVISDMQALLQTIVGVISVYKFEVVSHFGKNSDTGLTYTEDVSFDVSANTKNGIVFCPKDAVFEVRYPDSDLIGESK